MNNLVTAVKRNGQEDEGNTNPEDPGNSPASARLDARFVYPSGSRPLTGYTIKRGLGHGGFGEVYYATSDGGKEVALKLLRRNLDVELRGISHCLNLKHPHLLAVHDIREDDRCDKWVVMEYVSGQSLEEVVASHPQGMPTEDVLAWIHGIGAGVACLHDHGVVHRDLKPGNIFSDEGVVKVGDYGLSKFISCSRRSGQTESVGTVHYMAPEVANGRYGKEIDVYALGVVLFEMLTGRVPFEGESVGEVLMKHLTAEPDVSMLQQPYRSVVARALQKDPAKRFSSVEEMLAGLPEPAHPQVRAGALPWSVRQGAGAVPAAQPVAESVDAESVNATSVNEEPIFRAVRQGVSGLHDTWNQSNLNTPAKVILLVVGAFFLMNVAGFLTPVAVTLFLAYACYWLVRSILMSMGSPRKADAAGQPPPAEVPVATVVAEPPADAGRRHARRKPKHKRMPRWARRDKATLALLAKPPRQRVAELLGSLLGSVVVAATICLIMTVVSPDSFRTDVFQPERFAWLLLVSVAGSWAVLVPSKLWEGHRGEPMVRRFSMMVLGLGVGALAFGAASLLAVDLPHNVQIVPPPDFGPPADFYRDSMPMLMAHLTCFGMLLLVIRWWRLADPLRRTRLSIWSIFFCVVMAGLVACLWHFPQAWLMMAAGVMAVAVQLSSPWVHPRRRQRHPEDP